jgi:RNase P subunit RPR2
MKNKFSKSETIGQIKEFFSNIKNKTPKEIKKIKRLAMRQNIPLKEKRKSFCKKCYSVYRKPKIRIKNNMKTVSCENCGYISRWRL